MTQTTWTDGRHFLMILTGDPDPLVTIQTFDDNKQRREDRKRDGSKDPLATHRYGRFSNLVSWALEQNSKGAGIFVAINQTDGAGRRAENIIGLRALCVDDDGGAIANPLALPLPPSMVVRTKRGWHVYWLLHPGEPIDQFTAAQKALIHHLKTDPVVHDLPRVMRLPGFFHLKDPAHPFSPTIHHVNPTCRYTIQEVMAVFPPPADVHRPKVVTTDERQSGAAADFTIWMTRKSMADGERHKSLKAIVAEGWGRVSARRLDEGDALAVVLAYCRQSGIEGGEQNGINHWNHGRDKGFDANAAVNQDAGGGAEPAPWDDPIPLETLELPSLGIRLHPAWLGDMIDAVAMTTETAPELGTMIALAVLAVCCQRTYEVNPENSYVETLSLYTMAALESGNRKSPVFDHLTNPLKVWEQEQWRGIQDGIQEAESDRKTIEARVRALRDKVARAADGSDYESLKRDIAELESSMPEVPRPHRLWGQDVTPERLGVLMAENGERFAILSDEGGIFDTFNGRYSGQANLDLLLQGHCGTSVRVDRGTRPPVMIQRPALTIALSPQPGILKALAENPAFRHRGLLARFLFALPASRLGYRNLEGPPIAQSVLDTYSAAIAALLSKQPRIDLDGKACPILLRFSEPARQLWKEFSRMVEREMREWGRFHLITDWAGKLPGQTARIAALLHCGRHAFDDPGGTPIDADTMEQALEVAAWLSHHALAAFDLMDSDPDLETARIVWRWIDSQRRPVFKSRDCFDALKGRYKAMERLEPGFRVLTERQYIRRAAVDGPRSPGRPKRLFEVNPILVEAWR